MSHLDPNKFVITKYNWRAEFNRLDVAYALATMRSNHSAVVALEVWCHAQGQRPFPADVETVFRVLEDQGRGKMPSTFVDVSTRSERCTGSFAFPT